MASASNRHQREVIDFPPNVAVVLALKYAQGKIVSGISGDRVMLTTVDNRVCFLDPAVAGQIEAAGINVREPFTLTMHWDGSKTSPRTWEVAKIGEQHDGTMVVPKLPAEPVTPKPPATAASATPGGARSLLVQEADALVDAYALVLERALRQYEGRIKPDEVRSLLLSAYIQRRQLSTVAA